MRIGLFGGDTANRTIDDIVGAAKAAADDGFAIYALPQIFAMEALSVLAIVGREVPNIELGTGVVPTYPRHPVTMAQEALTAQAASNGRLMLGIGLSHQMVIENMFKTSFDKPVRHMREYLSVLMPLLEGQPVQFEGEEFRVQGAITVAAGVSLAAPPRRLSVARRSGDSDRRAAARAGPSADGARARAPCSGTADFRPECTAR